MEKFNKTDLYIFIFINFSLAETDLRYFKSLIEKDCMVITSQRFYSADRRRSCFSKTGVLKSAYSSSQCHVRDFDMKQPIQAEPSNST